jgi:hypothetical protein
MESCHNGSVHDLNPTDAGGDKKDEDSKGGGRWPWSKRDRLKREPSLDKLNKEADFIGDPEPSTSKACPDYFGVRSYLHNFYEWQAYKDPNLYEDEWGDSRRLLYPSKDRRCTATWWKAFVFVGASLLLVGTLAVLIGYLVPQRTVNVGYVDADHEVIDLDAKQYNQYLDICKLVGLILFCGGGVALAMALMVPSFLYRYCDDERREAAFSVQSGDVAPQCPVKDPMKAAIPASARLTEIQPPRKADEAMLLGEEGGEDHKYSLSAKTLQH